MADPQKAPQTQPANIERKNGKTLAQLQEAILASGRTKHGEIREWVMATFGVGHGDANTLAHVVVNPQVSGDTPGDALGEICAGKKAHLHPVDEAVMAVLASLGDVEVAPKKGYVSLRRRKQFAMLGPKSNERVELVLNLRDDIAGARILPQRPGGICQIAVSLTSVADVDAEVSAALVRAFQAAG